MKAVDIEAALAGRPMLREGVTVPTMTPQPTEHTAKEAPRRRPH